MKSKILGFLVQLLIAIIQGIIVSIVSQLIIKLILYQPRNENPLYLLSIEL